jgi:hypothetical protein
MNSALDHILNEKIKIEKLSLKCVVIMWDYDTFSSSIVSIIVHVKYDTVSLR